MVALAKRTLYGDYFNSEHYRLLIRTEDNFSEILNFGRHKINTIDFIILCFMLRWFALLF